MNAIRPGLAVLILLGLTAAVAAAQDAAAPAPVPAPAPTPAPVAAAQQKTLDKGGRTTAKTGKAFVKSDHLELGTTTVTGNQELPKVLYIVPWKKSDIGDLSGKPMNSLLDEVLAPVDRDVFRRETVYYHALSSAASQNGAPNAEAAKQGEK